MPVTPKVPIPGERAHHEQCQRCGWLVRLIDTENGVECPRCDGHRPIRPVSPQLLVPLTNRAPQQVRS